MSILKTKNGSGGMCIIENPSSYNLVHSLLFINYTLVGIPENRARYRFAIKSPYFSGIIRHTRRRLGKPAKTHDDKITIPYKNGTFYEVPLSNGAFNRNRTSIPRTNASLWKGFKFFILPYTFSLTLRIKSSLLKQSLDKR
jgi:hypothetical protein